jgi:hypothetical protein
MGKVVNASSREKAPLTGSAFRNKVDEQTPGS